VTPTLIIWSLISLLLLVIVLLGTYIVSLSVAKAPVIVKSNIVSHSVPVLIESLGISLIHFLVNVVFLKIVAQFLFDNLSALAVEHPFMSHLLVTGCRIVVGLMTFCYALSIRACSSLCLSLIDFLHRSSVRANFS